MFIYRPRSTPRVVISCISQLAQRLLQPEGAFICVSFAPPEERLELLEYWDIDQPAKCLAWDVHVDAIGELNHYHTHSRLPLHGKMKPLSVLPTKSSRREHGDMLH